jgi:7,8-dihydropterin-6-yl-methyl-4-(beta-D-ribofuranosyl)aminobenzene 5'-phosphate synthase
MKLTILYDNTVWKGGLKAGWGFSCLVEARGRTILFDTGAAGPILLANMKELGVDPRAVDEVFISHGHSDHTGGLFDFLKIHPVRVYIPACITPPPDRGDFVSVNDPMEIHEGIFSTGEVGGFEQSLVVKREEGSVLVVGCSHPGVAAILQRASEVAEIKVLLGGLHGFGDFHLIEALDYVCPTHCTQQQARMRELFPTKFLEGGAGRVVELP